MDYENLLNGVTNLGIIIYFIITFVSIFSLISEINSVKQGSNYAFPIIIMYMCISVLPAYILHLLI